jgi:hypothetical protein
MTSDIDMLPLMLSRSGKEPSRALPQRAYGDPAKHIQFDSEKGRYMDRIKELLREWASYHIDRRTGWPTQSAFATERVQNDNRSTETYREMSADIVKLNVEIEKFAPGFKRIIALEYLDRRPQKTKAAVMGIPRQVFSQRLLWCHEQLNYTMFGE